jgi:prepilin-type N-terminal cleavage/methylation domain-containing protein
MLSTKIQLLIIQGKLKRQTAQGFTMVEVIVAMLLTLIFTAISMQAIVMGTAVKVHGDEIADATSWIQEDLEDITTQATTGIDYDSGTSKYTTNPASTQCNPGTTSTNGYAEVLRNRTSINTGTIGSTTAISKNNSSGSKSRTYNMVRTATVKAETGSDRRYNVLLVDYSVFRGSTSTNPISTFHAEVIPAASFYCRWP